jgi:glycosyltransferase involved in cell wall biosynthesis
VMIEAMCNGLPVAGYNVPGPRDVIEQGVTGAISDNLHESILQCQSLDRKNIQQKSTKKWSWNRCFDIFMHHFNV